MQNYLNKCGMENIVSVDLHSISNNMTYSSMRLAQVIQCFYFRGIYYCRTGDWEWTHHPGNKDIHQSYQKDNWFEIREGWRRQEPRNRTKKLKPLCLKSYFVMVCWNWA